MAVKAYNPLKQTHDVVIVGAGGAGLRAALTARKLGKKVAVVTKVPPTRSHTVAAQGGINAALGNRTPDDWRWHMYDTVRGSDWLGDQDAIALMCERAPQAIIELEQMGVVFTRGTDGRIYQRAYGGQSTEFGRGGLAYRACASADRTGHALLHTLYQQCLKIGVEFFVEYLALDLLIHDGICHGILAWELDTGAIHAFHAPATILATGGYGQIYASTTSSSICTGDGGGMALRAGLPLMDMEFVQFHPTALYGTGILITEGARGEGGLLLNGRAEHFMERYAPKSQDLASRDVISRAMMQEIRAGRGAGEKKDHLLLSLTHLNDAALSRLPAITEIARTFGRIDVRHEPIPVLPAVHYTMGGIPADTQCRALNAEGEPVYGLFAAGEAACNSVHGANRLGCNSLLDLVVFGDVAGREAASLTSPPSPPSFLYDGALAHFDALRHANGAERPHQLRKDMQRIMQEHAGIYREEISLAEGQIELHAVSSRMQTDMNISDTSLLWNNDLVEAIELDNLMRQSIVTLASARARTESRGAHFREDFPARDDAHWLCHTLCSLDEQAGAHLATRPVRITAGDRSPTFAPEQRVY